MGVGAARFLAGQKPNGTAFVIGEGGLLTALHQHGYAVVDHDPDYVVVASWPDGPQGAEAIYKIKN